MHAHPAGPVPGAQQEFEGVNPNSRFGFPNFPKVEPVVKPETRVLSEADLNGLTKWTMLNEKACQVASDQRAKCRFAFVLDPMPSDVKVGSVLAAGRSKTAPHGLLAKVTTVDGTHGLAVEATWGDAFKEMSFFAGRELGVADVRSHKPAKGVTLEGAPKIGEKGKAIPRAEGGSTSPSTAPRSSTG
ncbi:MAG: hypothetical protein HZY73_09895 [Micropruina sp.]|nr:MAG: hypothetical protein HZY73_09895 [Micropruina sp.]